jgi:hypothetical protein
MTKFEWRIKLEYRMTKGGRREPSGPLVIVLREAAKRLAAASREFCLLKLGHLNIRA